MKEKWLQYQKLKQLLSLKSIFPIFLGSKSLGFYKLGCNCVYVSAFSQPI